MEVDQIDPIAWLATAASQAPQELKPLLESFGQLYERKLWYQLTIAIQEFLNIPSSAPLHVPLYQHFIRDFESKINPLRLVEIAVTVSQRYNDPNDALAFLSSLAESLRPPPPTADDAPAAPSRPSASIATSPKPPPSPESYVLAKMSAAHASLLLGRLEDTRAAMQECEKILNSLDVVDTVVRAGFYRVAGDLYKWEAEYASYYKTSLLYLACLPSLSVLSPAERTTRAHDLSLAALLGDIYNFGELLQHPILDSLDAQAGQYGWLKELLFAFNAGDLGKFESLVPRFPEEQILQSSYPFLQQKICLMALIDAVSKRDVTSRTIAFRTVAFETKISENEVEHLVLKALSLGLIQGSLDQVSRTVRIAWVQPRVLDKAQIAALQERLELWGRRVAKVGEMAVQNGAGAWIPI